MRPVSTILGAYRLVLIAYVIVAWVPRPPEALQPVIRFIQRLVDPVLAPLRRVMPPLRIGGIGLDLSILVLFFGISILEAVFLNQGL